MKQAILNNSIIDIKDFSSNWYNMNIKCKCCNEDVIICRGIERQYFRHKKNSECAYSLYSQDKNTQSPEHIACKNYLFEKLKNANENIFIQQEYPISNNMNKCIADVYAEYSFNNSNTFKYAFEIQKSPKTEKSLIAKNNFYKSLDIIPVWISYEDLNINLLQTNTNTIFNNKLCSGSYKFEVNDEKVFIYYAFSNKSINKFNLKSHYKTLKNFKLYGTKVFFL